MKFEAFWLVYPLLLLTAIALGEGVHLFFADKDASKQVNRRLRIIAAHPDRREAYELLRRKAPGEGSSQWLSDLLKSSPLRAFDRRLGEADIHTPVERVCLYIVGVMIAIAIGVHLGFKLNLTVSVAIGVVLGYFVPMWLINRKRRRRLNHLADQLPDAIDMLVRSLRAGHPVPTGISIIAHEMSDPIGTEFGLVSDEMSYGADFRTALEKMGERLRIPEINYMVVAMRIQYGTGGNLAEILSSLSGVMRARRNLFAKVRALSAESRLGGKILGAMPPGIVALITVFNPHFYDDVGTNTILTVIMGGAAFVCLLGMVLIRKIVNIRV